jgi:transcriptional regulator with XRE-family HTH domain
MDEVKRKVAAKLRNMRYLKGMSQTEAANAIGVSITTIHNIESGVTADFRLCGVIIPLCKAYGVIPSVFMDAVTGEDNTRRQR